MTDPQPFFRNAQVISKQTDQAVYLATGADIERGDPAFIMSSGNLFAFGKCPAKWREGGDVPDEKTTAMDFGSLADCRLLVPDLEAKRFAVSPENYSKTVMECPQCGSQTESQKCRKCGCERLPNSIEKPWTRQNDDCAAWEDERKKDGKQIIKHETATQVEQALKSITGDSERLIKESDHQVFCMAEYQDEATGIVVPVKTLPDIVPHLTSPWPKVICDMKCLNNGEPRAWVRQVFERGWFLQGALYTDVYCAAAGEERGTFAHLVLENEHPYHVPTPWPALTEEFLQLGRDRYRAALMRYCQCLKTNEWPSYPVPLGTTAFDGMQFLGPLPYFLNE